MCKQFFYAIIFIHCKLLANILVQYAGKVLEITQSSVDVHFGFTKSVPISQAD